MLNDVWSLMELERRKIIFKCHLTLEWLSPSTIVCFFFFFDCYLWNEWIKVTDGFEWRYQTWSLIHNMITYFDNNSKCFLVWLSILFSHDSSYRFVLILYRFQYQCDSSNLINDSTNTHTVHSPHTNFPWLVISTKKWLKKRKSNQNEWSYELHTT